MEDKTVELMVSTFFPGYYGHPQVSLSIVYCGESTVFDDRNELKRLVGRGGGERSGVGGT